MSTYVWTECACGGDIVSVSPDEDDVRIAVASHQEKPQHSEWSAVQTLKDLRRPNGPCICKGGDADPTRNGGLIRWRSGRVA